MALRAAFSIDEARFCSVAHVGVQSGLCERGYKR